MTSLHIFNELTPRDRGDMMTVLRGERLWIPTSHDYPRHTEWLDATEAAISDGSKRAFFARIDESAAGAVVYRPDEEDDTTFDIRNISIASTNRGRLLGSFMLRQVEFETASLGAERLRVDTKIGNEAMVRFLIHNGFDITDITDLYGDDTSDDVILTKNIA